MNYLKNNHYCSETGCDYTTGVLSEIAETADNKLSSDGGYSRKDKTLCPKCKNDSLIFLSKR